MKNNKLMENPILNSTFTRCSKIFKMIIMVLLILIFGFLSIQSILNTTMLEDSPPARETITFHNDNVLLNLILMILILVFLSVLIKNILSKISIKVFASILCIYTLVLGLIWIFSVKSLVSYDSEMLSNTAVNFSNGDYSDLQPDNKYFYNYPFQLGYVLVCQIVNIFFKDDMYYIALQVLNLMALMVSYLAFIYMMYLIFREKSIVNTTILLLFGCISGIMFTTFVYGNLVSLAFGMWAVALEIKYIKTEKKYLMFISAVLIGISIVVKSNSMIILMAMCIILLIKFLDTKNLWDLVSIMLCIVFGLNFLNIVIGSYENKANVDLGSGVPKILWLNMGLHESNLGCGWYDANYTLGIFHANNKDAELSTQEGLKQIKEQVQYFIENKDYTRKFFTEKILSQWNEPTYSCIWVSETREHGGELPSFAEDIYYNDLRGWIIGFMNQHQQIIFLLALICFGRIYSKKDISMYIMPLIVLGGFLYHMLFEAKSQYILIYFLMLVPMCSYGLNIILNLDFKHIIQKLLKLGASK